MLLLLGGPASRATHGSVSALSSAALGSLVLPGEKDDHCIRAMAGSVLSLVRFVVDAVQFEVRFEAANIGQAVLHAALVVVADDAEVDGAVLLELDTDAVTENLRCHCLTPFCSYDYQYQNSSPVAITGKPPQNVRRFSRFSQLDVCRTLDWRELKSYLDFLEVGSPKEAWFYEMPNV